jgi:hypothetical protein
MASKGRFFSSLAGQYFEKGMSKLLEGLVKLDPETATEAQIDALLKDFDDMSLKVAEAQRDFEKEQKEADAISNLFNQRLKAAEVLQGRLGTAAPEAKASLETSLGKLLDQIEEMKPDVDREKAEAEDAGALYQDMKKTLEDFAERLKTTRKQIEAARRQMKSADMQKERAKMKEANSLAAAGLKKQGDQLNVVLGAMNDIAEKDRVQAKAAEERARLLTPTDIEKEDVNIASAMAEATGETAKKGLSIEERLAALKTKAA